MPRRLKGEEINADMIMKHKSTLPYDQRTVWFASVSYNVFQLNATVRTQFVLPGVVGGEAPQAALPTAKASSDGGAARPTVSQDSSNAEMNSPAPVTFQFTLQV